jgi:hypothetical protein
MIRYMTLLKQSLGGHDGGSSFEQLLENAGMIDDSDFRAALHQTADRHFDNIGEDGADYSLSTIGGSGAQDPFSGAGDEDPVGGSGAQDPVDGSGDGDLIILDNCLRNIYQRYRHRNLDQEHKLVERVDDVLQDYFGRVHRMYSEEDFEECLSGISSELLNNPPLLRAHLCEAIVRSFGSLRALGVDYAFSTTEGSGAQDPVGGSGDDDPVGGSGAQDPVGGSSDDDPVGGSGYYGDLDNTILDYGLRDIYQHHARDRDLDEKSKLEQLVDEVLYDYYGGIHQMYSHNGFEECLGGISSELLNDSDLLREALYEAVDRNFDWLWGQYKVFGSVNPDESGIADGSWNQTNQNVDESSSNQADQSGDSQDDTFQDTAELDLPPTFDNWSANVRLRLDEHPCRCKGFRKTSAKFTNGEQAKRALDYLLGDHP